MKKLFNQFTRIFGSLRKFFSVMTGKATRGTGIAVKTICSTIGAGAAILVLFVIIIVIALAAIPYGAFTVNSSTSEEVSANANEIVDAKFTETHCEICGTDDIKISIIAGKRYCQICKPFISHEEDKNG